MIHWITNESEQNPTKIEASVHIGMDNDLCVSLNGHTVISIKQKGLRMIPSKFRETLEGIPLTADGCLALDPSWGPNLDYAVIPPPTREDKPQRQKEYEARIAFGEKVFSGPIQK
jgi:hypothetical protein